MLRARHAALLIAEFASYAWVNRAWWLLMIVPVLVAAVMAVGATHAVVPYTVYTLF